MILLRKLKIAIFISLIFITFSNVVLSNAIGLEGKIHKNIYVRDINLSGLTKEEAKDKINATLKEHDSFVLRLNEKEYIFKKEYIDVDYNVEELVNEAYSIGRKQGLISNLKTKANLDLGEKQVLDYDYTFSENKLNDYIDCLGKEVYKRPINSYIKVMDDDNIIVSNDKDGYKINKPELKAIIVGKIKSLDCNEEIIPITSIKANYLYEDLIKIDTVLGRFETFFNPNNENRCNNIRLAARATNNVILKEGEIFSFNDKIKNSYLSKYFKEATIIINGKKDKGLGGGMCQVSTTIYNAALYSGLKILNTKNHSIPSAYIEKGRDATVSQGYIDLKFSNKYNTPVLINNKVYENKIVSTIYGSRKDAKDIKVITKTVEELPNKIVIKNSDKYDLGEKVIEQEGRKGYKVETYRIYKYGDCESKEYISQSYYPPQDKIIVNGTREISK